MNRTEYPCKIEHDRKRLKRENRWTGQKMKIMDIKPEISNRNGTDMKWIEKPDTKERSNSWRMLNDWRRLKNKEKEGFKEVVTQGLEMISVIQIIKPEYPRKW